MVRGRACAKELCKWCLVVGSPLLLLPPKRGECNAKRLQRRQWVVEHEHMSVLAQPPKLQVGRVHRPRAVLATGAKQEVVGAVRHGAVTGKVERQQAVLLGISGELTAHGDGGAAAGGCRMCCAASASSAIAATAHAAAVVSCR